MATYRKLHDWNLSASEAIETQKRLRNEIRLEPPATAFKTVAGADISFNKYSETIYAGIVVLQLPTLEVIEEAGVIAQTTFPYIPGLLSFREVPALLEVWQKLRTEPDVLICDGQGIAHPRRIGIASHFGLLIERPTIGCAKSVLVGRFDDPAPTRGSWSPMVHQGDTVGAALRTKNKVNPVYVSPGHLIDLRSSIDLLLVCDGGYRIPEPTRRAHLLVNRIRTENMDAEQSSGVAS